MHVLQIASQAWRFGRRSRLFSVFWSLPFLGFAAVPENAFFQWEGLISEDIQLQHVSAQWLKPIAQSTGLRSEVTIARYDIEYRPPAGFLVGSSEILIEFAKGARLQIDHDVSEKSGVSITMGYSDGFADYRSLWIDTYYRQLFGNFPSYQHSEPWSSYGEFLFQYEFLPATGIFTGGVSVQYDDGPALWERDLAGGLQSAGRVSRMIAGYGSVELLANPKTRFRSQLWLRGQTNRDLRISLSLDMLRALGKETFLRLRYEYTGEGNSFSGHGFHGTITREFGEKRSVAVLGHYYLDNGEIEEATADVQLTAPAVRTREIGIKYFHDLSSTFRYSLQIGYYTSRYKRATGFADFATELYSDRDWLSAGFMAQIFF